MGRTISPPIVELAGATLRVGGRLLFRNTTWAFRSNEHWALVGANGSGKTLFANALTGAVPVVRGELNVANGIVAQVSFEQQKAVAGTTPAAARWFSLEAEAAPRVDQFLSQDNVEELNPFEVVTRPPAAVRAFAQHRQRVVRLLGIDALQQRPLPALSNGEMRKVLLARALLRRPRLLILDDSFAGLDALFRQHLKSILERLMRQGTVQVLLIATHTDELPRGITHWLQVDRCRVVSQGRFRPWQVRETFQCPTESKLLRLPVRVNSTAVNKLVDLRDVTVSYGGRRVLANLNWVVRRGESWALLGPNGSGKSTLLSLIIGDNPQAYANDVRVFGHRRGAGESIWALKRRIGWVSPELHLHFPEDQTCLDTVASGFDDTNGCYRRPTARRRRAARRWLVVLGLTGCATLSFGSVSAGLQRLTLLARALVKSPDLLVLDEPCQGLDAAHRARLIQIVAALLRHTTVIYVTHRRDEIPVGIKRVLRLR